MPDFFGRRNYLILFVLVAVSMIIFTAHVREGENGPIHRVQRAVMAATAPVQSIVTTMLSPVKDGWDYLVHFGQLTRENRELRDELADLRAEVSSLRGLHAENSRLRELVKLKDRKRYAVTTARVVGMPSSNWWSSIVIDKGLSDGVRHGMPAIAGGGLVGQVTDSSQEAAKVILINDAESGVSVQVHRTGEVGVIRGQLRSAKLVLRYVSRESTIKKGDQVYTSGLGGVFPKGLYIGRVSSVRQSAYSLYKTVEVTSPVDFSKIAEVMIVQRETGFTIGGVK